MAKGITVRAKIKLTRAEMIKYAEESHPEDIAMGQVVVVPARPSPSPTSVRLSEPLLNELDGLAKRQHRARGNLIQHILWEYVLVQRKTRPPSKRKAR
jgi:hypothetical protein